MPTLTCIPGLSAGCPIFATVLSSLRWAIFAAAKIPILQIHPWRVAHT
jgi:hypothetical protein